MVRNLEGHISFRCFTVSLTQEQGSYLPYRFTEFISDYTRQKPDTCATCISKHKRLTFPVGGRSVDRSAVDKKSFGQDNTIDDDPYYYCPLIGKTLDSSTLSAEPSHIRPHPVEPIHAILDGGWDDWYFFDFLSIQPPRGFNPCNIFNSLLSPEFTSTPSEKLFLKLWYLAMHLQMDRLRSRNGVDLEESDFAQTSTKLFRFLLPIPQVWVAILPHPMSRDYPSTSEIDALESGPQRVDFLLTYKGRLHVIEIDDGTHYGEPVKGSHMRASEVRYRKTLVTTRALERAGYTVHRFTNEEIFLLKTDRTEKDSPNVDGFIALLRSSGLDPEEMVFIDSAGQRDPLA